MLISLQSDLKKRIQLSLIIDLANDSIGSSECLSTSCQPILFNLLGCGCVCVSGCLVVSLFFLFCWGVRVGVFVCLYVYAAFRRGGEPVHTTCEYQWKVLTVLNNSPSVCSCVYVNKHKSQRERNKRNHNISLSTMQKIYISFVIRFLRLFIKIPSTETLHLTCFL